MVELALGVVEGGGVARVVASTRPRIMCVYRLRRSHYFWGLTLSRHASVDQYLSLDTWFEWRYHRPPTGLKQTQTVTVRDVPAQAKSTLGQVKRVGF